MKQFKVFYSWQSDLPSNKTKWFINECIKEAVKKCNTAVEGIEILADRDTQGKTGSPNIVQTIFEKIDECDLFIADVSIVNSHIIRAKDYTVDDAIDIDSGSVAEIIEDDIKPQFRYTPNPNVLIELGYAVKCLGWEKVLCFINTDFGKIEQLPFDLEHQRVTPYSMDDINSVGTKNNREKIKRELREIIVGTILELAKQGSGFKKGKAFHVVGTYDPNRKAIDADLVSYDVTRYCWIDEYNNKHETDALKLLHEIKEYKIPKREQKAQKYSSDLNDPFENIKYFQKAFKINYDNNMVDCIIGTSERDFIIEIAAKYLDIDIAMFDDEFFNLGGLRIQAMTPIDSIIGKMEPLKIGAEDEKEKYQKIKELSNSLNELQLLDLYLKTFDDLLLFPLAIKNDSFDIDSDIEVIVDVEGCEVVSPSADMINPEIQDVASNIYRMGYPMDLLSLQVDTDIKYDDNFDPFYNIEEPFGGKAIPGIPVSITKEDYGDAMRHYIATPIGESSYCFNLNRLRANEKKWLGGIIVVRKPKQDTEIKIKYKIISSNTSGDIEGELVYRGAVR